MFKKIVGFGDSWMYGDELIEPNITATDTHQVGLQHSAYRERNCFLGQLGEHYSVPIENFGIMGGSLQSANWTFLYWLEHEPNPEECLVLHGITSPYRFSYYNPKHQVYPNDPPWYRFVHSAWPPDNYPEFQTLIKQQTVLTDCVELRNLNYQQSVFLFDGVSSRLNIPMVQFNVFPNLLNIQLPSLLEPIQDLQTCLTQKGSEYFKPRRHPNELGHQLISNYLINHIDPAIIVA